MTDEEKRELKVQMAEELLKRKKFAIGVDGCSRRINEIATLLEGAEQSTGT